MSKKGIEPIVRNFLIQGEDHERQVERYEKEFHDRLVELAVSMGEDAEDIDWQRFAGKLAKKHEPRLQDQTKRGRPLKWGMLEKILLGLDIKRRTNKGQTVDAAIREIAELKHWINFLSTNEGATILGPDRIEALKKQHTVDSEELRAFIMIFGDLNNLSQDEFDHLIKIRLERN